MEHVDPTDVEGMSPPAEQLPDGVMADAVGTVRLLSDQLGTTHLAINQYELAPGESFTISAHAHAEQEELFVVLSGQITFETGPAAADGESTDAGDAENAVVVSAGELLRVPPGEFQLGTNRDSEPATALALGAPKEYAEGGQWKFVCADCGTYTVHDHRTGEDEAYVCLACGAEFGDESAE